MTKFSVTASVLHHATPLSDSQQSIKSKNTEEQEHFLVIITVPLCRLISQYGYKWKAYRIEVMQTKQLNIIIKLQHN